MTPYVCRHCSIEFVPKVTKNSNFYCSPSCYHSARTRPLEERFWERVEKTEGCWLWVGTKKRQQGRKASYGTIGLGGRGGGNIEVHRLSWILHHGPIQEGLMVRHAVCGNSLCVRPDHLALGTHDDNMRDMAKDGSKKGTRHHGALLDDEKVREIRRAYASQEGTMREIGLRFGVKEVTVYKLIHRMTWKHVA